MLVCPGRYFGVVGVGGRVLLRVAWMYQVSFSPRTLYSLYPRLLLFSMRSLCQLLLVLVFQDLFSVLFFVFLLLWSLPTHAYGVCLRYIYRYNFGMMYCWNSYPSGELDIHDDLDLFMWTANHNALFDNVSCIRDSSPISSGIAQLRQYSLTHSFPTDMLCQFS